MIRGAFVLVVIAGCAQPHGADATRSTRPSSASSASSAPASASASTPPRVAEPVASAEGAPDVVYPLPPVPPGADPELVMFTASICAAATMTNPDTKKVSVGCRSHPPFDAPEQKPDGKLVPHTGDPLTFCSIDRIYRGSFTRPLAKQAMLSFTQCKENDPNATWDMGFPGSAVLVEEIAGRWKAVGYEPAVNTASCLQDRRADGRDVLLCRSGLGAGTAGAVIYFFLLDFGRPKKHAGTFAKLFTTDFDCGQVDMFYGWDAGLTTLRVTDFALADLNKDGTGDLVVQVMRAHVPPSPGLEAKVRASCKQLPKAEALPVLPAQKKAKLEFLSDGTFFAASPATKALLASWDAESPEGFNGLSGAAPEPLTK